MVTDDLLAQLTRQHWQLTGFVNEAQLEGPTCLSALRCSNAGMEFGREPKFDFLLHVSRLHAASVDALARRKAEGGAAGHRDA